MTKYETVYILEPSYDEVKAQEFADKVTGWMKDLGAEVVEVQKWGKRRLAYEVRKRRDGVYTMVVWNGAQSMVKELERRLRLEEAILRALTTEDERKIEMQQLRAVSTPEKIVFPLMLLTLCVLMLPSAAPLVGMFALGNLMNACGVVERLSQSAQNELINIVTSFLGLWVGSKLSADAFLQYKTLGVARTRHRFGHRW